MELIVNGEPTRLETPVTTIQDLLRRLGYDSRYVAVALNETAVLRQAYAITPVREADRVEILSAMQGG